MSAASQPNWDRLRTALLVLCCLGLAAPLVVYSLIGTTMRYSGDDYCYAATLTQQGFWGTQQYAYLHIAHYNGNRFSLNLFSSLADLAGPSASGFLPAMAVILWLAGLFWALKSGLKIAHIQTPALALFVAAEGVVFATLAKTPDIDQSLFWRSGMLPYLAPILCNGFLAALLLRQVTDPPRPARAWMALTALLAFVSGGFSETFGLVQAAWLGLALFSGLFLFWRREASRPALAGFIWAAGIALLATLAALLVMALSPTVFQMKPHLAQPPNLVETLQLSMLFARRFLSTLKTAPLENLFPVVLLATLAVVTIHRQTTLKGFRLVHQFALLFGLAAATYLLIVTSMLGFAYVQQSYPEPRAEIIPRFILSLAEAAAGWLVGIAAVRLTQRFRLTGWFPVLAGVILLVLLAYPLWTGRVYWGELPRYQRWAEFWDRRDQEIRQALSQGILDVHVMEIDHIIPRVVELSPVPEKLYNQCAAAYYGLNTITADLPGWDE